MKLRKFKFFIDFFHYFLAYGTTIADATHTFSTTLETAANEDNYCQYHDYANDRTNYDKSCESFFGYDYSVCEL